MENLNKIRPKCEDCLFYIPDGWLQFACMSEQAIYLNSDWESRFGECGLERKLFKHKDSEENLT